jgi:hypothetical protein
MAYQYLPPNWKVRARIWIGIIFVVLCVADYCLWRFANDQTIPESINMLRAVVLLVALSSKAMLIGMWRRQSWARYALIGLLFTSLLILFMAGFATFGTKIPRTKGMWKKLAAGIVLQAGALVPLGYSRSIRRQMHPMTGRD